ncbi:Uma2 family endonuclease [Nocardia rosealba]|uniref:Uma2 family endonuclease n=1 Tax=Nocardia rosealba TaxID=2878563 RepID=UPI0027E04D0B|nr:Uma2 family endonuclease [Nocardia rosealba]
MAADTERCWVVDIETNVFLGESGKSDYVTPDFWVHRCLGGAYRDVRASDTALVGEVLSPSNTPALQRAKRAKYAKAGIPWYWEVTLEPEVGEIAVVAAYGLDTGHSHLPDGVRPLCPVDYRLVGQWVNGGTEPISMSYPFPIEIPWSALQF